MKLNLQKRLAAKIAKAGVDRVHIEPDRVADVKEAITKSDIRSLIAQGAITIRPIKFPSRHRARKRHLQRKKGRQRGDGRRKGAAKARSPAKREWINTIRAQRRLLTELKSTNRIDHITYRNIYAKARGGFFRDRRHLMFYLKQNNLLKEKK